MDAVSVVRTFPSARLPSATGGVPVEVSLIAQLGHGAGNHLFESVAARQRSHGDFVDALDEPSARIGATDLARGDATALYSFAVGAGGHPFHRHAGHRIFTAISGSGGARLRFCSVSDADLARDPDAFVRALRHVDIPADCLFTVRFGGETWHQFAPLSKGAAHPAFFALSCHTNELGGALSPTQRQAVLDGSASIPVLTDVLPEALAARLASPFFDHSSVPCIALALDAPRDTLQEALCRVARGSSGTLRGAWSRRRGASGFVSVRDARLAVEARGSAPVDSLLRNTFADGRIDHEDYFVLRIERALVPAGHPERLLADLLQGFLDAPPQGVGRLMALRNVLVRPLGLRTSPLGCPVSSLLGACTAGTFAGRFPVLEQRVEPDHAQVLLGADDKHLRFRSCVAVRDTGGAIEFSMSTRVQCRNAFGRAYMALIDRVHRGYIAPSMLRLAVHQVLHADAPVDARVAVALPTL